MKALLAAAALAASALPAASQQMACGPRDKIVAFLASEFAESSRSIARTGGGGMAELFRSEAGTWSLVVTSTDGTACIVSGGNAWEDIPPVVPGSDA